MPYTIAEKKEYDKKHYLENKDKISQQVLAYKKTHPEKVRQRNKNWQQANKDKCVNYSFNWRKKNYKLYMITTAKGRAKKNNLEFNLTVDDFEIPEFCPILLIRLNYSWEEGYKKSFAPSLDRIDNSKGYIKGNVRVISDKINGCKRDLKVDEISRLLKYMQGELN